MSVDAERVVSWVRTFAQEIADQKEYLTELDSAIGDADHGINMDRGMKAVVAKLDGSAGADIGQILKTVGMTLISTVGGASGPLYGTFFLKAGTALAGAEALDGEGWAGALEAATAGVMSLGKADVGEKTMLDSLVPARDALRTAVEEGASLGEALHRSADAAEAGVRSTIPMIATKGRASYLGERSAGHQDPGATSAHLLLRTAANTFT